VIRGTGTRGLPPRPWTPNYVGMDPTSHIPPVKLFHYLIHAMPLSEGERNHLEKCSHCQAVLEEWERYIDPALIHEVAPAA